MILAKHLSTNGCVSAYPDEESAKAAQILEGMDNSNSSMHLELSAEDISGQVVEETDREKSVVALQPGSSLEAAMELPLS